MEETLTREFFMQNTGVYSTHSNFALIKLEFEESKLTPDAFCQQYVKQNPIFTINLSGQIKIDASDDSLYSSSASDDIEETNAIDIRVKKCEGDKEVSFETNIISWNLENVAKLLTGSAYVETDGVKTFTYADSDSAPIVFLRFIHTDETDNRKVTIDMYKAQFTGELELDFNKKDAVSFNYAFDLLAKDNGTKHVYFNVAEKALA